MLIYQAIQKTNQREQKLRTKTSGKDEALRKPPWESFPASAGVPRNASAPGKILLANNSLFSAISWAIEPNSSLDWRSAVSKGQAGYSFKDGEIRGKGICLKGDNSWYSWQHAWSAVWCILWHVVNLSHRVESWPRCNAFHAELDGGLWALAIAGSCLGCICIILQGRMQCRCSVNRFLGLDGRTSAAAPGVAPQPDLGILWKACHVLWKSLNISLIIIRLFFLDCLHTQMSTWIQKLLQLL